MGQLTSRIAELVDDQQHKLATQEAEEIRFADEAAQMNAKLAVMIAADRDDLLTKGLSIVADRTGVGLFPTAEEDGMPTFVIGYNAKQKDYLVIAGRYQKKAADVDAALDALALAIHRRMTGYSTRTSIFEDEKKR